MRILIVSQYFWPESFRVNDLAAALVKRGHEVTALTGQPNYPDGIVFPEFRAAPERFSTFEGVRVVRVPLVPRGNGGARLAINYASFALSAWLLGSRRLGDQNFDVIFAPQLSPVTSCLPAIALGRRFRIPVVVWSLDLWPETLQALGVVRSPILLGLVGRLVGFIYRRSAMVLGQSRTFERSVTRHSGDPRLFRYFPQWAEPLFASGVAQVEPAPEVRRFAGAFNVLFAGNIGDSQDFPSLLAAAECLRDRADVNWLIVGDGRAAPWVREEIARRGLGERVHLLGRYPLERMPAFYRGADALLVTLKRDPAFAMTIPGKVQTYLASGVPLLGMLDGEGATVIEESGAGYAAPAGDPAALAACVERLAALPPGERAAMGRCGQEYSAREFDRETLLSRLESWFRQLSSGGRDQVSSGSSSNSVA